MLRKKVFIAILFTAAAVAFAAGTAIVTVQVKETPVRDVPSFTGKPLGTLKYGDKADLLEEKGPWMRVSANDGKLQGWIHGTSVTKKDVKLTTKGGTGTAASGSEVALAGKGFNAEIEAKYRSDNAALDFKSIDEMEKVRIKPAEMQAFLVEGGITPREGGL